MDGRTTHSRFTIPTNSARRSLLEFQERRAFSPKTRDGAAYVSPKSCRAPFGAAITPVAHSPQTTLRAAVPDCWCHVLCVVSGIEEFAASGNSLRIPTVMGPPGRVHRAWAWQAVPTKSARFVGNKHQDRK